MTALERLAPAKINLGLAITGRRADGYHELSSVFMRIGLSDRLTAELAPPGAEGETLEVRGDPDSAISDNLVLRTTSLMRQSIQHSLPPLSLGLHKQIPMAAGLGGGSSDAAATLELAAAAWGLPLTAEIRSLAPVLGADVPFFTAAAPVAHVTGIGQEIAPLPQLTAPVGLLLVTPRDRLSTQRVYAAFDGLRQPTPSSAGPAVAELVIAFMAGMGGAALIDWSLRLSTMNALWPAAVSVAPQLERTRVELETALGRPVLLSGSGPTFVALYPSADDAAEAGREATVRLPGSLHGSRWFATDDVGPQPIWRFS